MTRDELLKLTDLALKSGDVNLAKMTMQQLEGMDTQAVPEQTLPRAAGLMARNVVQGVADTANILTEPLRYGMNKIGLDVPMSVSGAADYYMDKAGLPEPYTDSEKISGKAQQFLSGGGGFVGTGGLLSKAPQEISKYLGKSLTTSPMLQGVSAMSSGAAGEQSKLQGGGATSQVVSSLLAGIAPAGVASMAKTASNVLPMKAKSLLNNVTDELVDKVIQRTGVQTQGITPNAMGAIKEKVTKALQNGDVDEAGLKRLVEYEKVNATPTKGSITLNPADITQQKNLAKIGMNTSDKNLQRLGNITNENEASLLQGLDDLGASQGYTRAAGGKSITGLIQTKDSALNAKKNALYKMAESQEGREIPLDRSWFVTRADELMRQKNSNAFLPPEVKTMLNEVSYGQKSLLGEAREVPFNVNTIDTMETVLSNAMTNPDGNVRMAAGAVKQALVETPMRGKISKGAMDSFREARKANRELMVWRESSKGIKSATDKKGVDLDNFMEKFVLNKSADTKDVSKLANEIKKDPEVMQTVRNQIMGFIKDKALNQRGGDTAKLSSAGLHRAIKDIGDNKLKLFFTKSEIDQLKTIRNVSNYEQFQPTASAVNNSNSGTTVMGGLLNLGKSAPFIKPMITDPLSSMADSRAAKQIMNPGLLLNQNKLNTPYGMPLLYGSGGYLLDPDSDRNRQ